jgi:probable F420-dependent oxidoreductase
VRELSNAKPEVSNRQAFMNLGRFANTVDDVLVETLLPLGKVDPGLREPDNPLDIRTVYDAAKQVEELGFSGLVVEETKDDPFQILALAAQATTTLRVGTAVAIAFPRSPYVTAMSAWSLQRLSNGRHTLGLGTQVRGHVVRRFGQEWHPAGPWVRDYISTVRSIWDSWQNKTPLSVHNDHYNLDLTVPLFVPAPVDHPNIPIHLAAVKPGLCKVAGEVADGVRPHPVCTADYMREVMLPAAAAGALKAGRSLEGFQVAHKPLIATAPDEAMLALRVRDARARISFYLSTPAYRPAFEHHGFGDLAQEAAILSKAGRWEELPELVTDDLLHTYVTVGTWDQIGARIKERFGEVVTTIEFSIAPRTPEEGEFMTSLIRQLEAP